MEFVYEIEAAKQNELRKVLDADPYADDSFSRLGYVLKESNSLGLPASKIILYFKCVEEKKAKNFVEKLKAVGDLKEVAGEAKDKVISAIKAEEESAAAGFGSIFGE